MTEPMRMLLIEDNPDDALLIKESLTEVSGIPLELEWVDRLSLGLERLDAGGIDVVLTDLNLPDSTAVGLDTLLRLRARAPDLPIVIMTGQDEDERVALDALEKGAQDYLVKVEIGGRMLYRVVRYAIERKKIEKALKEVARAKSEFTSVVSHELRTPLTVIKEGIGIVADQSLGPLNPAQRDYLQVAQKNIDRLARLINDILDYQRLETGQMPFRPGLYDINAVIQESLRELTSLADKKGLRIETSLAEGLPQVTFDKDKIMQVFMNLVNNAIKFTDKGKITIRSERSENTIRVAAQDEGIGIKAEDMPKLFQSFGQIPREGHRETGGTGLGLAISKEIMELHRGKIGVDSVYGQGSTFYFLLPIVERRS